MNVNIYVYISWIEKNIFLTSLWVSVSCSVMSNSANRWTVACQIPLSMEFPWQEYWSGLPCPFLGNHPDPGIKPIPLVSPALQVDSLLSELPGKPNLIISTSKMNTKIFIWEIQIDALRLILVKGLEIFHQITHKQASQTMEMQILDCCNRYSMIKECHVISE